MRMLTEMRPVAILLVVVDRCRDWSIRGAHQYGGHRCQQDDELTERFSVDVVALVWLEKKVKMVSGSALTREHQQRQSI